MFLLELYRVVWVLTWSQGRAVANISGSGGSSSEGRNYARSADVYYINGAFSDIESVLKCDGQLVRIVTDSGEKVVEVKVGKQNAFVSFELPSKIESRLLGRVTNRTNQEIMLTFMYWAERLNRDDLSRVQNEYIDEARQYNRRPYISEKREMVF